MRQGGVSGKKLIDVLIANSSTEVRFKSLRRPSLGGLMGGGCLKVGRATG